MYPIPALPASAVDVACIEEPAYELRDMLCSSVYPEAGYLPQCWLHEASPQWSLDEELDLSETQMAM